MKRLCRVSYWVERVMGRLGYVRLDLYNALAESQARQAVESERLRRDYEALLMDYESVCKYADNCQAGLKSFKAQLKLAKARIRQLQAKK